uniref:Uncharacterized protein n=1 Tax=Anguilla anguilla TaxID=7936 RepID=A0A0E9W2Q4_ANGAN
MQGAPESFLKIQLQLGLSLDCHLALFSISNKCFPNQCVSTVR